MIDPHAAQPLAIGDGALRGIRYAAWPAFYTIFVVAAAIHAPLGLRTIAEEWLRLRGRGTDAVLTLFAAVLLVVGLYAVRALAG